MPEYFHILFDDGKYTELDKKLTSGDPLHFEDTKKYVDRVKATQKNTGLFDAIRTAKGKLEGHEFVVAAMDFSFIGGSMGFMVGRLKGAVRGERERSVGRRRGREIRLNLRFWGLGLRLGIKP